MMQVKFLGNPRPPVTFNAAPLGRPQFGATPDIPASTKILLALGVMLSAGVILWSIKS